MLIIYLVQQINPIAVVPLWLKYACLYSLDVLVLDIILTHWLIHNCIIYLYRFGLFIINNHSSCLFFGTVDVISTCMCLFIATVEENATIPNTKKDLRQAYLSCMYVFIWNWHDTILIELRVYQWCLHEVSIATTAA